jgi:hypothetical protein
LATSSKRCAKCGETKPLEQFVQLKRPNGSIRPDNYCRACRKELNVIYHGNRRRGHTLEDAFEVKF